MPACGDDADFDVAISGPELQDPLYVMMAALNAFSIGWPKAFSISRCDLAQRFAEREAERISRFAPDSFSAALLKHMAALSTLCGGLTNEQALQCCSTELATLQADYPGNAARLARDLGRALQGSARISTVGPDIVAEAFIILVLQEPLQDGAGTVRRSIQLSRSAAGVLVRALTDFAGTASQSPRRWLDNLIKSAISASDADILYVLDRSIPYATVELRNAAVEISGALLKIVIAHQDDSLEFLHELAKHETNLANRITDSGYPHEALPHATEAVETARKLVIPTYRPILAMALNNLANVLSKVGRYSDAVQTLTEAVAIYRGLAREFPNLYLADLAISLTNIPNVLGPVDRTQDALAPAKEAVSIYVTVQVL